MFEDMRSYGKTSFIEYLEELDNIMSFINHDPHKKEHRKKLRKIIKGIKENNPKYIRDGDEYDED